MIKGPHLSISSQPSKAPVQRIIITKKLIPLATQRNWWRRRIREILRQNAQLIRLGVELRIKVHSCGKMKPSFRKLEEELLELLRK